MRFLSCKILQCPFTCFCKLKMENATNQLSDETADLKGESFEEKKEQQTTNCLKSNIKKPVMEMNEVPRKKQVQWMDFLGKELVEIREFEFSDIEDMDSEGTRHRGCICV